MCVAYLCGGNTVLFLAKIDLYPTLCTQLKCKRREENQVIHIGNTKNLNDNDDGDLAESLLNDLLS